MYRDLSWLKAVVGVFMALSLVLVAVFGVINVAVPMWQEMTAQDKLYAGEIVDKKIINASSGLFSSSDMDYRLVIQGEYECNGRTKETEKSISVDKETYQSANIGDWFDSHTIKITDKGRG